jgi:formylglycine-generating enzyme required for sulfatase activity
MVLACLWLFQAVPLAAPPAAKNNPELLFVPAGCYQMGDNFGDGYFNEKPAHEVCITDFFIGKYDITREEFALFATVTGYKTDAEQGDGCYIYDGIAWRKESSANWRNPGFNQADSHPAVCISWNDAIAYAHWLSQTTGRTYRLPSEAEWEYAARSKGKIERFAGGNDPDKLAWHAGNADEQTHPVGQKQPNGLGLYDMSGNVWQWTADWYDPNSYRKVPSNNQAGPNSGTQKVFRGGSWFQDPRGLRTSYRDFYFPHFSSSYLGFRLAVTIKNTDRK